MVRRVETRRARSERYTEESAGKTVLMWRGYTATLIEKQAITLSDGATEKECAVILIHGKELFQALRFVSAEELEKLCGK